MENEKELTPEASLQLISQVIVDARKNFQHSGFFILLWGWIVIIASLACFFSVRYLESTHQYEYIGLGYWVTWGVPTLIGMGIQFAYIRRVRQVKRVKSQFTMIIRILWYANFVAIVITDFIALKQHFSSGPFILVLVGLAAFVTGYIIRFRPLMYGAIVFGIGAIIDVYITADYQLLIGAISIAFGYLIPGYMLQNRKSQ